jgi:Ca-activated chloride channel homolog
MNTRDNPISTFSADVDTASYSHVRRWIRSGKLPPPDAVRPEELINAFQYNYATPGTIEEGFRPTVAVLPAPWAEDLHLLHIGIKAFDGVPEERSSVNLVLLLDVSGSMADAEKLALVRQAMCVLVHGLSEKDLISIVTYAGEVSVLLPPTSAIEKDVVLAALDGLVAGGGTAGKDGLSLAYATARLHAKPGYISRVMLATDGDFNIGPANPRDLMAVVKRQSSDGIGLSVLGFGQGNTRDDIMQSLAQNGNGIAVHIDSMAEAMRVLSRQLKGTLFTVAKDVKFQVEFNPAHITSYRLIGYETRALEEVDFADDAKDAGDVGSGHVVTALHEVTINGLDASPFSKRRYAPKATANNNQRKELAFVKIRFKPAGETDSVELSRPVTITDQSPRSLSLSADIRFAVAIAWFAQKLRGVALANSDWLDIAALASGALGRDTHGERAEFLDLIHKAMKLDPAG